MVWLNLKKENSPWWLSLSTLVQVTFPKRILENIILWPQLVYTMYLEKASRISFTSSGFGSCKQTRKNHTPASIRHVHYFSKHTFQKDSTISVMKDVEEREKGLALGGHPILVNLGEWSSSHYVENVVSLVSHSNWSTACSIFLTCQDSRIRRLPPFSHLQ